MRDILVGAIAATLLLTAVPVQAADGWIARCDEPRGPRIDYGREVLPGGRVEQTKADGAILSEDGFSNVYPVFIYRGQGAEVVEYVWGNTRPDDVDPSLFQTPETKRAAVLTASPSLVSTAELFPGERWLSSFYPKLGVVMATRHAEPVQWHESNLVAVNTFVMECEFSPL
jgi:hypothetical protein